MIPTALCATGLVLAALGGCSREPSHGAAGRNRPAEVRANAAPMPDCSLRVSDGPMWRDSSRVLVIDSRPAEEFRRIRIPRSVNVPLRTIRTKSFARSMPILIVGDVSASSDLRDVCVELLGQGFASVRILEGGLREWMAAGGELAGEQRAVRDLRRLTPQQLKRIVARPEWLIVDVSSSSTEGTSSLGSAAVPIPLSHWRFQRNLQGALEAHRARYGDASVVLVDRDGARQAQLEEVIESLPLARVYYLDGGAAAYRGSVDDGGRVGVQVVTLGCERAGCGKR